MAVCSYCRSTLVRDGESLRRIGQSAELFDDHSPLQLGVVGVYQGEGFSLDGRLQMAYEGGTWNEWHALFVNGRSGWLSEDNGGYVFGFDAPGAGQPIAFDWTKSKAGQSAVIDGRAWSVASVVSASFKAVQGELPFLPDLKRQLTVVELRNPQGEVLTLDTHDDPPRRHLGRAVELPSLKLSGLREAESMAASVQGKAMECPSCGAGLVPKLDNTKSITCASCRSVVDISKGLGADLDYYRQDNALEPLIPLGTSGLLTIDGKKDSWQVVGYMERCDEPSGSDDEQTFWREYLLYSRRSGFAFLVDAEDGWSTVRPITGAPSGRGDVVQWGGVSYKKRYAYTAKTTYVLGEFYWRVYRDQRGFNTDYVGQSSNAKLQLNCEQSGDEVVWSAGQTLQGDEVARAFRADPAQLPQFRRGSTLLSRAGKALSNLNEANAVGSGSSGTPIQTWITIVTVVLVVLILFSCSDDCDDVRDTYGSASTEYQQCRSSHGSSGYHGGSWGGYSSGGSHK
jgi:hypothetical protein